MRPSIRPSCAMKSELQHTKACLRIVVAAWSRYAVSQAAGQLARDNVRRHAFPPPSLRDSLLYALPDFLQLHAIREHP